MWYNDGMSKYVKTLRNIGYVLILLILFLLLLGKLPLGLPVVFFLISDELLKISAWVIPLIFFLFFSPVILDYARKYDIKFLFENRGDDNLNVTVINLGDTAFSFNRIQFFAGKSQIAQPDNGKLRALWFRKSGETTDFEMRENAGCTVKRGVPLIFWTHKRDIQNWLAHIREKAPKKRIYCRLYFGGTNMEVKSKQALEEKLINELIKNT